MISMSEQWRTKGELAAISHKFSFVLRPNKGKYHWLKVTLQKLKLIDNRPSWPALNFRGKWRNTTKHFLCRAITELTQKKKTSKGGKYLSPSVRDNCRLRGCSFKVKFGPQASHNGTENLFQSSKQKGLFGVILAKLCESVNFYLVQNVVCCVWRIDYALEG